MQNSVFHRAPGGNELLRCSCGDIGDFICGDRLIPSERSRADRRAWRSFRDASHGYPVFSNKEIWLESPADFRFSKEIFS